MSVTELKSGGAVRWLRGWLLLLLAAMLWAGQQAGAGSITDVKVVNVTPSGFSVVWRSVNTTPSLAVFADAGGATNLTGQLGIEAFPVRTGNPDLAAGYPRRTDVATLKQLTSGLGLMFMRVSGCQPNTAYHFQLTSTPTNGTPEVYPATGPLPTVVTPTENSFVTNDQMLILDVPIPNGRGSIVLLSHTNAAYALASVVGDGVGTNQAFFNVNDLFALANTGNFTPLGDQHFTLNVLAPGQTDLSQSYTLTFTADLATALATQISLNTDLLALQVGSAVLRAGQSGTVPLTGSVNTNLTSIDLTLQIPPGYLTNLALQSLAPTLNPAASTLVLQGGSTWQLHLGAISGQTFIGSNLLAQIAFTAVSNLGSAFVPLQVTVLNAIKSDATAITRKLAQSGRVVVIANEPLLEAGFAADGSRQLTLFGKAPMSYAVEYNTNLLNPGGWTHVQHFVQTNMVTLVGGLGVPSPNMFYRALEFAPDPPVLDAVQDTTGKRTMLAFGQAGKQYTVLAKTNLSNVVPWTPVQSYTLTNSYNYLAPTGSSGLIFYRLQRN